jgi:hypothetical protein
VTRDPRDAVNDRDDSQVQQLVAAYVCLFSDVKREMRRCFGQGADEPLVNIGAFLAESQETRFLPSATSGVVRENV